jgi:hypothetical protein
MKHNDPTLFGNKLLHLVAIGTVVRGVALRSASTEKASKMREYRSNIKMWFCRIFSNLEILVGYPHLNP